MDQDDIRHYDALRHTRNFCHDNRPDFETAPTGPQLIADLDAHVSDIDRLFGEQKAGHGLVAEATEIRDKNRTALRTTVDAIVNAARVSALQSTGIDRRFRRAPATSDRSLIAWGRAFLASDEPTRAAIAAAGVPAKVLADLPGQIDAFEQAIDGQVNGRDRHVAARRAITSVRADAVKTMAGLDAIACNAYYGNAGKLAEWKHARRRGPAADAAPAAPAPAPAGETKTA
jgi:hypothetical protein